VSTLVRAFRAVAEEGEARLAVTYDTEELGEVLGALFARARAAHPELRVPEEAFGAWLARSAGAEGVWSLKAIAVEDLYLACACAQGGAGAAEAFERQFGRVIRRAVGRVLPGASDRDEAEQLTRRALLVGGPDAPPKIAQYLGRGALEKWVSVSAIRVAVSLGRSERTERRLRERAAAEVAGAGNPELSIIKGELRGEIEVAFEEALGRLDDRERLILRLYLVSGMTMADIGKSLGTSQQAVSRALARARKRVLADVRRQLGERLKVAKGDLASIARLVASRLDISISRLLGAE
jgi:RNA polymerase sigma-70 factor (ECF subfamily)